MTPKRRRPKDGLLRWLLAVGRAKMPQTEKSVLYSLTTFVDWRTGRCFPSVASVAHRAGITDRTTRAIYEQLREKGVLVYLRRSKGGTSATGKAMTHELEVNLAALEALAPDHADTDEDGQPEEAAGFVVNPGEPGCIRGNPGEPGGEHEPGTSRTGTRNLGAPNPEANAREPGATFRQSTNEQPKKQPSSTTQPVGGVGVDSASPPKGEKAERSESTDNAGNPVFDRLISLGVSASKARVLAQTHTLEEIDEAARDAATPALLVFALQDDTAKHRIRLKREEAAAMAETQERHGRLIALSKWAIENGRSDNARSMEAAWGRSVETIDALGIVTLDELRAAANAGDAGPTIDLIERLAERAEQVLRTKALASDLRGRK